MAVFVAAGDESERGDQTGPFIFGGWVAPALHWLTFTSAWERRVLNGNPPLKEFHTTCLKSPEWQGENGWTEIQAEARIDDAIQVIKNSRKLLPVLTVMDGGFFRDVFKQTKLVQEGKQIGVYDMDPDYVGFLGFALSSIAYVAAKYPDAESVDFVIERKTKVTHHMEEDFHSNLDRGLRNVGLEHLIPLIGQFRPENKKHPPLQAADALIWHYRRWVSHDATDLDWRRLRAMGKRRLLAETGMTHDEIARMGRDSKAEKVPNPFPPKVTRVRDGAA